METILRCPNPDCGSTDLEYSEPDGATICMSCHTIVEENAIVSSVEFNENAAGGASTVVGQFVGPEMTKVCVRVCVCACVVCTIMCACLCACACK
jgi:hypothetical protein